MSISKYTRRAKKKEIRKLKTLHLFSFSQYSIFLINKIEYKARINYLLAFKNIIIAPTPLLFQSYNYLCDCVTNNHYPKSYGSLACHQTYISALIRYIKYKWIVVINIYYFSKKLVRIICSLYDTLFNIIILYYDEMDSY